jgi:hypothetical protein
MNYVPHLPDPVAYKVAEWGLPPHIELAFYEHLQRFLETLPRRQHIEVKTCEFSIPDGKSRSFIFYGRVGARIHKDAFLITFCEFDCAIQE